MKSSSLGVNRLALDPAIGSDLRAKLQHDPQAAVKQSAQQFEGLLLHLMLKSMRDAGATGGLLDSDQSRFFTAIGDQQLAQDLAAHAPLGFAALIEKQLARQLPTASATSSPIAVQQPSLPAEYATKRSAIPPLAVVARGTPTPAAADAADSADSASSARRAAGTSAGAREFVDRVWTQAVEAAAATGVPAHFLVAHSALESGWGKREIRGADGSPSFNLFGIKAGRSWSGPTTEVQTTEFINGQAQSVRASFRVYGSYAEAFRDYAQVLSSNPRFSGVIGQRDGVQFARSLQQAGYATDPMYADKLARIIGGTTLRQALAAA